MEVSTFSARFVYPLLANQRGLSGISSESKKNKPEGTHTAQNIQRHPICPFQEASISAAVTSAGTGSAKSIFTICAPRMPNTIVN